MAKEYIEREAFIKNAEARYCDPCKEIGKDSNGLKCRACWVDDMVGDIEDTPAADVAEVVRCENCQYYELLGDAVLTDAVRGICTYRPMAYGVKDNDFCSYGERKGDVESDGMDQRKR